MIVAINNRDSAISFFLSLRTGVLAARSFAGVNERPSRECVSLHFLKPTPLRPQKTVLWIIMNPHFIIGIVIHLWKPQNI